MDRDGSIPHLFVCCIIRTVPCFGFCFVIIELLRIYTALSPFSHSSTAVLFLYSNPGWIPCIRLSRFYSLVVIYSYRTNLALSCPAGHLQPLSFLFKGRCHLVASRNSRCHRCRGPSSIPRRRRQLFGDECPVTVLKQE